MIQALEISRPLAGTIAKERPPAGSVSLNAEAKAADTAPISFLKQVVQAPSPFGRLKAALLKHHLVQGMPAKQADAKAVTSAKPEGAQTPAPSSEAESVFVVRADDARYASEPSDFAKTRITADQRMTPEIDPDAFGLREMSILSRGMEFPKLDASWQILPTAEFAKYSPGNQLEMLV